MTDRYLALHPNEASRLAALVDLLDAGGDVASRRHMPGHLTASALIVDPEAADGPAVLLIHHKGLGKWLQPGGHLDPGEVPIDAARREAAEEVGLTDLVLHPWHAAHGGAPIDVDIHPIPANPKKGEPTHFHHDFRYLFLVPPGGAPGNVRLAVDEVAGHRWAPLNGPNLPDDLDLALSKVRDAMGGSRDPF
ncbi:MAG: hydrolase [Phycisphaerales bacterium]|nr:hydrolase [Phycisphaerales bacterium]